MTTRIHLMFSVVWSLVVVAAVVWGVVLVGSPGTARLRRFDQQRLADLQTIAREIQLMVEDPNEKGTLKEALPGTLAEAAQRARNQRVNPRDPETGQPYRYTVKSETTYELCAHFSGARDWDLSVFWNHSAGDYCFTIDVLDPPPF